MANGRGEPDHGYQVITAPLSRGGLSILCFVGLLVANLYYRWDWPLRPWLTTWLSLALVGLLSGLWGRARDRHPRAARIGSVLNGCYLMLLALAGLLVYLIRTIRW